MCVSHAHVLVVDVLKLRYSDVMTAHLEKLGGHKLEINVGALKIVWPKIKLSSHFYLS